ncbi:MAG: DUF4293 domain-containing protein [Cytophagaceae bacterium]|nr:DUF4293 domain-containing protein [Cytophagaceae bacterium]MDW8455822.1 DUF4293 domain-containing protein [Cytophagaceae bacterium]
MIQRVQSIFMFLICILLGLNFFTVIWQYTDEGISITVGSIKAVYQHKNNIKQFNTIYISILTLVSLIVTMITLFSYKKRILQIKLSQLNTLLISGIIGTYFIAIPRAKAWLQEPVYGEYQWGFYIPIVCLLFNFISMHFIRKDEELVRSIDRIR